MKSTKFFTPVQPSERIPALDVIRGFALFGVLLAYALWNLGNPPQETYSQTDRLLNWALAILIDTKFYTLFAFLFGLGFSMQLTRAEGRGISIVPVYCRRLLALLLIGLAHALLLRNGDILVPYAVMGFILLLFRKASNKALAVGAIIGLVCPYLARGAWDLTGMPFPQRPEAAGLSYLAENYLWVRYWYATAITFWPAALPMFLFGLYMGRRRVFENIAAHRNVFQAICAGACGYIAKPVMPAQLLESVEQAFDGASPMSPHIARKVLELFRQNMPPGKADYNLSERELEVLDLLTQGHDHKAIAEKLFLSPFTIRAHLRNIYDKLHVHSKSQAVAKALQERLLPKRWGFLLPKRCAPVGLAQT